MTDHHRYATPHEAEAAFYAAFATRDLDAMMRVWVESDDAVCIHPMGERIVGRAGIAASWQEIFRGDGPMRFTLSEPRHVTHETISVHYVHEDIRFGPGFTERSRVIATNVYVKTARGWRIQAHHGSPGVRVMRRPPPAATVH